LQIDKQTIVPTYIYETIDPAKPVRELEIKQDVYDDPRVIDPLTGEAIRRIAAAGYKAIIRDSAIDPCANGAWRGQG